MAASEPAGRPLLEIEKVVQGLSFEAARAVLQAPPYGLKVKESAVLPELYLVAYDMLRIIRGESSWEQPVVRQARGMILEKGTNRWAHRGGEMRLKDAGPLPMLLHLSKGQV
jgi:hypothetical protein